MDKCRKTIPMIEINKCIECPSIRQIGAFYSVIRRRNQTFLRCFNRFDYILTIFIVEFDLPIKNFEFKV